VAHGGRTRAQRGPCADRRARDRGRQSGARLDRARAGARARGLRSHDVDLARRAARVLRSRGHVADHRPRPRGGRRLEADGVPRPAGTSWCASRARI
jgi:hypothetical protein